jgi:UDPglucose 6-dehydrogenase
LEKIKGVLRHPVFIDLRNVYDPQTMADLGFAYTSVGRSRAQQNGGGGIPTVQSR